MATLAPCVEGACRTVSPLFDKESNNRLGPLGASLFKGALGELGQQADVLSPSISAAYCLAGW